MIDTKYIIKKALNVQGHCGEGGIRTLGTSLRTYDGLANR